VYLVGEVYPHGKNANIIRWRKWHDDDDDNISWRGSGSKISNPQMKKKRGEFLPVRVSNIKSREFLIFFTLNAELRNDCLWIVIA
jgi:hypothetical protein